MKIWPILASLLFASTQESPKPEIGWNLKPGEKVRYEIEKTVLIHHKSDSVDMTLRFGFVLEAGKPDPAGLFPLKVVIDRVVMSGKDSKEEERYDSDSSKAEPKHPSIRLTAGCLNGTFDAKLSKAGAVTDVTGLKEILEKAADAIPEIKATGAKEAAARFAASFEHLLLEGFALAPGKALAKGETWDSELPGEALHLARATIRVKSTLKEVRGAEVVIGRETTVDFSQDPTAGDSKGSGRGEVTWSTELGRAVSGRWTVIVETPRGRTDVTVSIKLAPREKK